MTDISIIAEEIAGKSHCFRNKLNKNNVYMKSLERKKVWLFFGDFQERGKLLLGFWARKDVDKDLFDKLKKLFKVYTRQHEEYYKYPPYDCSDDGNNDIGAEILLIDNSIPDGIAPAIGELEEKALGIIKRHIN
jgi:hypothetical protein